MLLRQQRKKCLAHAIGIDLRATKTSILLRYAEQSKRFFSQCTSLMLCTDGSRIGGAELQLYAVFGITPDGKVGRAWPPPPQVLT